MASFWKVLVAPPLVIIMTEGRVTMGITIGVIVIPVIWVSRTSYTTA